MSTKNNSLHKKLQQLDELVAWFQSDEFELEMALENYKQAEALASEIDTQLTEFKNDIAVLKQRFDS